MGAGDGVVKTLDLVFDNGSSADRWNLVLMPEGFIEDELEAFRDLCDLLVSGVFMRAPFDAIDVESAINIWRLEVASKESGIDDPVACEGTGFEAATFLDGSFCGSGVPRILDFASQLAEDAVVAKLSDWDVIVAVANHEKWGATSYGPVSMVTTAAFWIESALHELGHSGFGLADEYPFWKGCETGESGQNVYSDVEPMDPNVTASPSAATLKWSALATPGAPIMTNPNCSACNPALSPFPAGTVGAFEGAGYFHCGLFRPEYNCRMRSSEYQFCAVCQDHIRTVLYAFQSFATKPDEFAADVEPWPAQLRWTTGKWDMGWEVELSPNADFSVDVLTPTASELIQNDVRFGTATVWLKPATSYYWRVRKTGLPAGSGWTASRQFTTKTKAPSIISPVSSPRRGEFYPWDLTFRWTAVAGAGGYQVEVSDDDFQSTIFPAVKATGTTEKISIKVKADQKWRVRAVAKQEGGPDNVGAWSAEAPVKTSWPAVTIKSPDDNEKVYPWPVKLHWDLVTAADYYIVEMGFDEAHFGPESVKMLNDLGVQPKVEHPGHHVTFNMRPRYLQENDQRFWRVRVFGPPPLSEEGKPAEIRSFVNHGDLTIVPLIQDVANQPFDWTYRVLESWEQPPDHTWEALLGWNPVKNATEYVFWGRPYPDDDGPFGAYAWVSPVPVDPDDDDDPRYAPRSTAYGEIDPPPQVGVLGYHWGVTAKGPEGILGLGEDSGWGSTIQPDPPVLVAPSSGATDVALSEPQLVFTSHYTPSGKYRVQIFSPSESFEATIDGEPGAGTSFDPTVLMGVSELEPATEYKWRVRAVSEKKALGLNNQWELSVDPDYPWGPIWSFTTQSSVLDPPALVSMHYNVGDDTEVWARFVVIPDATHYNFDYEQIPFGTVDPDSATPLGESLEHSWSALELDGNTQEFEMKSGQSVPNDQVVVPLPETNNQLWYRVRVAGCTIDGCSLPSPWGLAFPD